MFFFFLDCGIGDIDWRRGGVPGDSHDYCVSLLQAKKEVNKRCLQRFAISNGTLFMFADVLEIMYSFPHV